MPQRRIDPARLEGDDLRRWYLRTPEEIQREREAAEEEQYRRHFAPRPEDRVSEEVRAPTRPAPAGGTDDVLWVATGRGYRAIRPSASSAFGPETALGAVFPSTNAAAPEEAELLDVGNPYNRRLKREWVRKEGTDWPKTEDGRNYHVAHKRAIADGGTNTLDNIEPKHPDEHLAEHVRSGDATRWGRRPAWARLFGGTVEPPLHGPKVRSVGPLGIIPSLTGILSGRIRTDTPEHFWWDMIGFPAPDDYPPPIA